MEEGICCRGIWPSEWVSSQPEGGEGLENEGGCVWCGGAQTAEVAETGQSEVRQKWLAWPVGGRSCCSKRGSGNCALVCTS